jgi:hypothetical protein
VLYRCCAKLADFKILFGNLLSSRHKSQAAVPCDELNDAANGPTASVKSTGRDMSSLELQAADDCLGEEKSDSEDEKDGDYHNSYCESCRKGGELM